MTKLLLPFLFILLTTAFILTNAACDDGHHKHHKHHHHHGHHHHTHHHHKHHHHHGHHHHTHKPCKRESYPFTTDATSLSHPAIVQSPTPSPTPYNGGGGGGDDMIGKCFDLVVGSMTGCFDYLAAGDEKPSSSCCAGVEKVIEKNEDCICLALQLSGNYGIHVNLTKAAALPQLCRLNSLLLPPTFCGLVSPFQPPENSPSISPISLPPIAAVPFNSPQNSPSTTPSIGGGSRHTPPATNNGKSSSPPHKSSAAVLIKPALMTFYSVGMAVAAAAAIFI